MCDTPFKTPHAYSSKSKFQPKDLYTPGKVMSDSEESTASSTDTASSNGGTGTSGGELSIVAEFDDFMRLMRQKRCNEVENSFIAFTEQIKMLSLQYSLAFQECKRLQAELDAKIHQNSDLENKLHHARKMLDQEKKNTRQVRKERDDLELQMIQAREILVQDKTTRLPEETREKIPFLSFLGHSSLGGHNVNNGAGGGPAQLSAIPEVNSTGSILSDFSYSRSEDDLDSSHMEAGKGWKKHRPSTGGVAEPAVKKRRSSGNKVVEITSSDTVRATTTLTVSKKGPITATSIIESVPKAPNACLTRKSSEFATPSAPPANLVFESWARDSPRASEKNNNVRQHTFQQKIVVMPDTCSVCENRVRFGHSAMKCKDCRAFCHPDCKDKLPLPCVPLVNTPNQRNVLGVIGDFTPTIAPMVPGLIIHCANEIEMRGMNELGLYRVPGSERDVKALKEKFLKGRGAPCLNGVDIHVLCGTVKDFLRSLAEPLVTYKLWKNFIKATQAKDRDDIRPALYEAISELPQPNRDTLAYMVLHLQKIAETPECKMPIGNLAKVFGPTIVGYSSRDPDPQDVIRETAVQNLVMEHLLHIPNEYWSSFVNVSNNHLAPNRLQQTPSTDSLLRATTKGFFTPNRPLDSRRKQKYFATPPLLK